MQMKDDYENSGMSIQKAKVDQAKLFPNKESRPEFIRWGQYEIRTAHCLNVPDRFTIKLELLSAPDDRQGVDIKVDNGSVILESGKEIPVLRTWHDPAYESVLEYKGRSNDNRIWIYNIYKEERGGRIFEEKWTRNAGFWVEEISAYSWIYHCSPGWEVPPNFDSLVFKVTLSEEI